MPPLIRVKQTLHVPIPNCVKYHDLPANGLTSGAVADAAMVAEEVKADIGQPRLAALACEARRANACLRQSTLALSGDAGGTVEASTR